MGKSKEQKEQQNINLALSRNQLTQQKQAMHLQRQAYGAISPFAQSAIGLGNDALAGRAPAAFYNPLRNSISSGFAQSRQNLIDALGQSGQYGSGISAGPLAALETEQNRANLDALLQAQLQGLNVGFQGANLLAGQQAVFDPTRSGAAGYVDPQQYRRAGGGFLGSILGAGIGAIPGVR